MSLVLDDDRVAEQVAAFEAAIAGGDAAQAVFLAQRFLEAELDREPDADGFVPRQLLPAPGEEDLHLDAGHLVARRLASAAPAFAARYREICDERAEILRRHQAPLGPLATLGAAERFPLSSAGLASLEAAAQAALEAADGLLAARLFGDLLDLDWRAAPDRQLARRAGLLLAAGLGGEAPGPGDDQPEGSLRIGSEPSRSLRDLVEAERRRLGADRADPFRAGRPGRLELVWEHPLPGWEIDGGEPLLPVPRAGRGLLLLHDRGGIEALDQSSGRVVWERAFVADEPEALGEMDDPDLQSLAGALEGERYFLVHGAIGPEREIRRRLVAVSVADGQELWRYEPGRAGDGLPELLLDPNLLVAGDRLYVTAFDEAPTPSCHVLLLDARSGRLLAATRLPAGVPLPYLDAAGEARAARHWLAALPPALVQGFLLVADDQGQIAALEATGLEPRFLLRYDRGQGAAARRHRRNPILAVGDRIVVAPDDAAGPIAFFLRPAADARRRAENRLVQVAAHLPTGAGDLILGFDGLRLYSSGHDPGEDLEVLRLLRAFVAEHPSPTWSAPLDSPVLGPGFFGQKAVYVCTHKYVYGTDLSDGAVFGPLVSRETDGEERLGSLSAVGSGLVIASRRGIRVYRPAP